MPLLAPARDAAAGAVAGLAVEVSLHTADPGETGANEVTGGGYGRYTAVWNPVLDGLVLLDADPALFAGPPNLPVSHVGLWTGGGVWLGGQPAVSLAGDLGFNNVGVLGLTNLTITFGSEGQFILGETRPHAANTGLSGPITTVSTGGNLTISVDGTVVENTRFERKVSVTAKNVTFRNCDFAGGTANDNLLQCTNANVENLLVERCLFRPRIDHLGACVFGHDFTLRRCDLSGMDDAVSVNNGTAPAAGALEGCYLHDLAYFCPHPTTPDGDSHPDGIQVHSDVDGLTIIGCTIDAFNSIDRIHDYHAPTFNGIGSENDGQGEQTSGYQYFGQTSRNGGPALWATAAIMFSPAGPSISDVRIERNWIDGGSTGVNFGTGHTYTGCTLIGNRFGRDFRNTQGFANVPTGWTVTGNTRPGGLPYSGGNIP